MPTFDMRGILTGSTVLTIPILTGHPIARITNLSTSGPQIFARADSLPAAVNGTGSFPVGPNETIELRIDPVAGERPAVSLVSTTSRVYLVELRTRFTSVALSRIGSRPAADWTAENPVLGDGEIGYDETTREFRVGDGTTPWGSLTPVGGAPAGGLTTEQVQDIVGAMIAAGDNISTVYDDAAGTVTIAVSGLTETVQDIVAAAVSGSGGLTVTYDDAAGTLVLTIADGALALSKLAPIATARLLGNVSGSTGAASALTAAQAKSMLAIAAGDVSGLGGLATRGSVTATDVTDFTEAAQDVIGALALGGSGLTATYNDAGNTEAIDVNVDGSTLEISTDTLRVKDAGVTLAKLATQSNNTVLGNVSGGTASPAALTATQLRTLLALASANISDFTEAAQDAAATMLTAGTNVSLSYNDAANTLTVNASAATSSLINVKSAPYNATGNGSTDDTVAIQAALTAASASPHGAAVYFPDGTYIISNWLVYYSGTSLVGNSKETVTIKNTTTRVSSTLMLRPADVDIHDVTVQGITWDQRGDSYDAVADSTSEPLMDCSNTVNMTVQRCGFKNVRTVGVYGDGSAAHPMVNLRVLNNHVYQAGGDGISLFGSLVGFDIAGNLVEHAQDDAIAVQDHASTSEYPTDGRIVNNTVLDCDSQTTYGSTPNGIYVFGGDRTLVANNYVKNVYGSCLKVGVGSGRRATLVTLRDNQVGGAGTNNAPGSGTPAHGVMLNGVDGFTIGNTTVISANKDYNFSFFDYTANTGIRVERDGGLQAVTYASSITPNPLAGETIMVTLTGNVTFVAPTVAVSKPGGRMGLQVTQDATGSRAVTLSGAWKGTWTPVSTANAVSASEWQFDGTNWVLCGHT